VVDRMSPPTPRIVAYSDRKSDWRRSCREGKRSRCTLVMAVARRALPRMVVPVLVIKPGCDGSLSIISGTARSTGGGGFDEDDEVISGYITKGRGVSR
jgi:hypothetical protein